MAELAWRYGETGVNHWHEWNHFEDGSVLTPDGFVLTRQDRDKYRYLTIRTVLLSDDNNDNG